jgi:predicted enzyme related to lactoylglutathione lyase
MTNRTIVHIEIAAKDADAAAKFYHDVFGWEINNSGPPLNYEMFRSGNVPGGFPGVDGGMYKAGDVIVYIASDDLAADGKRIETAGGKMLAPPMDVPGMGAFAFFSDPNGARLALWKATTQQAS